MDGRMGRVVTVFLAGLLMSGLGWLAPVVADDAPTEQTSPSAFRVGVTQAPMYTLASALAWGSPVETLLVEQAEDGRWQIPDNLTVLFWTGPTLEPELGQQLSETGQAAVSLIDAVGVHQLAKRTPVDWKGPLEDEDPHMESLGKGYGMVQTIRPEGVIDTKYWLDPLNAMAALETVAMVFQGLDQRNHWGYQANLDQIVQALWELDIRINKLLHDASSQSFIVLQDEFQYFEQRYKLNTVPAGGNAQDIVAKAKARGAGCVVAAEPMDPHLQTVLDSANLNSVVLDPEGKVMPKTTGGYFQWFGNLAGKLNHCVTRS